MTSTTGDFATIIILKGMLKCKAMHVTGRGGL
jgi:hypothetical protein